MSFECEHCHDSYTKAGLIYHIDNGVCLKPNQKTCPYCEKIFSSVARCVYHVDNNVCKKQQAKKEEILRKIFGKGSDTSKINVDNIKPEGSDIKPLDCNITPERVKIKLTMKPKIEARDEEFAKMAEELAKTKEALLKSRVEVETLRSLPPTINNNLTIIAPPMKKTDTYQSMMRHMPKLLEKALLKHPGNCILFLIKNTICNPEYPIFNSVKITNKKDPFALISNGIKYEHINKKNVVEDIIESKRSLIQTFIDEDGGKFDEKKVALCQDYMESIDDKDSDMSKDLSNRILCALMDISTVIGTPQWAQKLKDSMEGEYSYLF